MVLIAKVDIFVLILITTKELNPQVRKTSITLEVIMIHIFQDFSACCTEFIKNISYIDQIYANTRYSKGYSKYKIKCCF